MPESAGLLGTRGCLWEIGRQGLGQSILPCTPSPALPAAPKVAFLPPHGCRHSAGTPLTPWFGQGAGHDADAVCRCPEILPMLRRTGHEGDV